MVVRSGPSNRRDDRCHRRHDQHGKEREMTPYDWAKLMRGTRYHEAGHAVAAYLHGYEITRVTVTDEEYMTNYRRLALGGWAESWREACVTMAGQLADQCASWGEMRPRPWAEFLAEAETGLEELVYDEEMRTDDTDLLLLLREMSADPVGDDLEESYRIVVEETRQLVSEHWTEIEAVACALEEKKILDGPEVVRLIEKEG